MPRKRKSTGGAAPSTQAKRAKKRLTAQGKLTLQNSETQETKQPREGMIVYPFKLFTINFVIHASDLTKQNMFQITFIKVFSFQRKSLY